MRTMIILSALPGSGKSTWARKFTASHKNTHIISSDEIRKELFGSVNSFDDETLVWKTFLDRLNSHKDSEEDVYVIADATNLSNKYREYYHSMTPDYDKHILVLFDIPYEICLLQNQMREPDRIVPMDAMERLQREFEQPSDRIVELYDEIIRVTDIAKALQK